MPPKPKDNKKGQKQGTALKEIIPVTIKQPPREARPIKNPEFVQISHKLNEYSPQAAVEDWPGDEAALTFDFGVESGKIFTDSAKLTLPPSLRGGPNAVVFWRRPKELLRTEAADSFSDYSAASELKLHRKKTFQETDLNDVAKRRMGFHNEDPDYSSPNVRREEVKVDIFQSYDRDETPEEVERRIKEIQEAAKNTKKKGGKKEEIIDTPMKISDVKLSNIDLKSPIPAYSKWIASQLQMIKDRNIRDANNKKPIWSKVYPQKNGVPIYNPSGRYWVKLYYMGKERKVEIDDKVPVVYNASLFPRSVNKNEIWPSIITKALIKLNSSRWIDPKSKEIEIGDGSIIYALTGYIPETIDLTIPSALNTKWKFLVEGLNDEKFNSGDTFLSGYCLPDYKPTAPSNKIKNVKELALDKAPVYPRKRSDDTDNVSLILKKERSKTQARGQTMNDVEDQPETTTNLFRERPTNIIPGFAYSLVDAFENENFNMVYVLKRNEQDLKLRQDYMNLQKVSLNKMSKEEKLEFRKQKKELKDKISEEDKKRLELISKPAIQYRLLKIKSNVYDIFLAKKCILNKLSKPPNYDLYDLRVDDNKSVSTSTHLLSMESGKLLPLDDFSKIENAKDPLKRGSAGAWLTDRDFLGCFQYVQIFHNPSKFKHNEITLINSSDEIEMANYENKEVVLLEPEGYEEEKTNSVPTKALLTTFSASRSQVAFINPKPYLILQKYDFQNFEVVGNYKTIEEPIDSDLVPLENKSYVFRLNIMSPLSFHLSLYSDFNIKTMSVVEYLCKHEGFNMKTQSIDYPPIDKNRYHLFYKALIQPTNERERLILKFNGSDQVLLRHLRLKVVEVHGKDFSSNEDFMSGVVEYPNENTYLLTEIARVTIEPEIKYALIIEGKVPYVANEGSLEINILSKRPDFVVDQVENLEPVEYTDKYIPTKYGIIFRERLFVNNEVNSSLYVRLANILGAVPQTQPQKGKKGEVVQVEEQELTDKRLIKFELFRDDHLIGYCFGYNHALLSNVTLFPTNDKENRNYYLQASIDLREWPEAKELNDHTQNLSWILKVFSNDTIGVVRDTQKEDTQKAIKKAWEDNEIGRAEKAKKSRRKYMILEKRERGEKLDAEELEILNEPRQRRAKDEDNKKDPKKQAKPKQPPPKAPTKKDEPVEEKKVIERPVPKASSHFMHEINEFLTHMEQPRLLEEPSNEDEEATVRPDENKSELRERILMGKEEIYGMQERNQRDKEKIKGIISQQKATLMAHLQQDREAMKQQFQKLVKQREEIKAKIQTKHDKEKALFELCKQEKPNFEDLDKMLNDLQSIDINLELIKLAQTIRKNSFVLSKIEKLSNALTMFDLPVVTATVEEIKSLSIEVDEELLQKADELIEEAKRNPNFIVEKQKEMQKAMKGKKK